MTITTRAMTMTITRTIMTMTDRRGKQGTIAGIVPPRPQGRSTHDSNGRVSRALALQMRANGLSTACDQS
jgi:hypothetical protein